MSTAVEDTVLIDPRELRNALLSGLQLLETRRVRRA